MSTNDLVSPVIAQVTARAAEIKALEKAQREQIKGLRAVISSGLVDDDTRTAIEAILPKPRTPKAAS